MDWASECPRMAEYYGNAFVTIAATICANSSDSFLTDRPVLDSMTFYIRGDEHATGATVFEVGARKTYGPGIDTRGDSPIATRTWTWQENALSTRTLHFTETEIFFECRGSFLSEDGTTPDPTQRRGLTQAVLELFTDNLTIDECYECWHDCIDSFSPRSLTYSSDKLPAISAVAQNISSFTGSEYLAGLWRNNLVVDLTWKTDWDRCKGLPLAYKDYVAPSWSWASVDAAIMTEPVYPKNQIEFLTTVIDCSCEVDGTNPFGHVRSGHITVSGAIVKLCFACSDPSQELKYWLMNPNKKRDPMRFLDDDESPELEEDDILAVAVAPDCVLQEDAHGDIARVTREEDEAKGDGTGLRYCPFVKTLHCLQLMRDRDVCHVVLLSPVPSRGNDCFIRVGAFEVSDFRGFSGATVQTVTLI